MTLLLCLQQLIRPMNRLRRLWSLIACDRVIVASTSIVVMWNHKRSSRAHRVRCCCNVVFVTQTPWTDASLMLTELTNEARLHIIATLFDSASLRSTKPNTSLRVIVATSAPCSSRSISLWIHASSWWNLVAGPDLNSVIPSISRGTSWSRVPATFVCTKIVQVFINF